jgi:hypothetical protein
MCFAVRIEPEWRLRRFPGPHGFAMAMPVGGSDKSVGLKFRLAPEVVGRVAGIPVGMAGRYRV